MILVFEGHCCAWQYESSPLRRFFFLCARHEPAFCKYLLLVLCMLQNVFRNYYTNENLSGPFCSYWGAGYRWEHRMTCAIYRTPLGTPGRSRCLGVELIFSLQYIYVHISSYNRSEHIQFFSVH